MEEVVEVWKTIEDHPDYNVSDIGNVCSFKGNTPRILKPGLNSGGYLHVRLFHNKKSKTCKIHTLVLEAFEGPCPKGMEGCHENGIRHDNRKVNLRWDTHKNNEADKVKHGTNIVPIGSKHYRAKLKESDIPKIRGLYRDGLTELSLAKKFDVARGTIGDILHGRTWGHVQGLEIVRRKNRGRSKLDEKDIPEIRELKENGLSFITIGKIFNVSRNTISHIINRKTWKHVA